MKYYTIQGVNNCLLISDNQEALSRFYKNIYPLPEDYEEGKYIIEEIEEEIDIPDYDEEGNLTGNHKETIMVKKLVLNSDWETEQAKKEQERIAQLSLTKREVFLALYRDKGITPEQIKAQLSSPEALIEFEYANDYFRGNPLIDLIGQTLGYTKEELDYLFEHKELPEKEENNE